MGVTLILQARRVGSAVRVLLTEMMLGEGPWPRIGHECSILHLTGRPSWLGTIVWTDKFNPTAHSLKQQCQECTYAPMHLFTANASRWTQESVRDPGGSHGSHGTCVPGKPCFTRWRIFHRAEDNFRGPFEPLGPPVVHISRLRFSIRELVGSRCASHKSLWPMNFQER